MMVEYSSRNLKKNKDNGGLFKWDNIFAAPPHEKNKIIGPFPVNSPSQG